MKTMKQRFWEKVDKTDGCWEWKACIHRSGYGQFSVNRKKKAAHRVAYEMIIGEIPEGLELDHLCRNRSCVNPAHLEPVTHKENMQRSEQATKTHCVRGHAFDADNTQVRNNGKRRCLACRKIDNDRRNAKRKVR